MTSAQPTRRTVLTSFGIGTLASTTLTGCGDDDTTGQQGTWPDRPVTITVAADPGTPADTMARRVVQSISRNRLSDESFTVKNVPGAAGTVGLAEFVKQRDNAYAWFTTGLSILGGIATTGSEATMNDTTPLARLASEWNVVVTPANSSFRSVTDLVDRLRDDPKKVRMVGGSAGGVDHVLAGQLAAATNVDPQDVNYTGFPGAAQSIPQLLGGKVDIGLSAIGQYLSAIEDGKLRALAVAAPERVQTLANVPTLKQEGVDVQSQQWRGLAAARDLDSDTISQMVAFLTKAHSTETWRRTLVEFGWADSWLIGQELADFMTSEQERISGVLRELGLLKS
ncbi:MAG: Bug family tripartite tricarboxylate transporter substrate binding protein [Dermatophilaceae bacterium]